jgi:hypothetical protein
LEHITANTERTPVFLAQVSFILMIISNSLHGLQYI